MQVKCDKSTSHLNTASKSNDIPSPKQNEPTLSTVERVCISLHWIFVSLIFHIYFSQFVEHELKLDLIVVNHIHFGKSGCDTEKLLVKSDDVHDINTHKFITNGLFKISAQTFIRNQHHK